MKKSRGAKGARRSWRTKALWWAVGGLAVYFAVVDFLWLLVSSGSWLLALEAGAVGVLMVLLVGWPAWLLLWAVALACGSAALALVPKERYGLRRTSFASAVALGCGALAYVPLAAIYGTQVRLSPFDPAVMALATMLVGFVAAWSYYPGRRPSPQGEGRSSDGPGLLLSEDQQ